MKIYFVRHQALNVLHEVPFLSPPTELQIAAVLAHVEKTCGKTHPKTKEPYWTRVVTVETVDGAAVPVFEAPGVEASGKGSGLLADVTGSGTGTVKNP